MSEQPRIMSLIQAVRRIKTFEPQDGMENVEVIVLPKGLDLREVRTQGFRMLPLYDITIH